MKKLRDGFSFPFARRGTMNIDSPGALIKKGESEVLELKEGFDKEVIETTVAFVNTKGGTILIGVADKGKVKGVQVGKETLKNWANGISQW